MPRLKTTIASFALILSFAAPLFAQEPARQELDRLVPSGSLEGWRLKGPCARYDASNLYLYIDGQAEFYIDYGFRSLLSGEFVSGKERGAAVVVDIYDMGDKDRAFGIYSAEKDESAKRVDAGAEGYQSGQVLNFWKGPFYVKISALGQIAGAERIMPLLARSTAGKIAADNSFPERALRLRIGGYIPGSIKYTPKSFLGHSFITNTYSAEYIVYGGAPLRLFISEYRDPAAAVAAFRKYRDFVSKAKPKLYGELDGFGEEAFIYSDPLGKEYIIARKGKFLCGAASERLADSAKIRLKKLIP